MNHTSRHPSKLSDSLHHQLRLYALAASAAGVGVLASAQPAEAKIVYTKTHVVIRSDTALYSLDLNHDGITDFQIGNFLQCGGTFTCWNDLYVVSAVKDKNAIEAAGGQLHTYAYALNRGVTIESKRPSKFFAMMVYSKFGFWYDVSNRYLGLKFQIKAKTHYGWARLTVSGTYDTLTATLTGYAYETIPGKSIIAGATHGPDVVVKHATLGELASGRK